MEISQDLKDQIYFVIPAYNEAKVVHHVIEQLHSLNFHKLIFIDDGSTDNTYNVIKKYQDNDMIILKHVINRGQGAALKTGIDYAIKQKDCKYIVTYDSDCQHRITDLPKFIKTLEKDECDIAIGSRFLLKESKKLVPLKKRILLRGALLVTYFLSNIILTDTHNGYRVMNKKAAQDIEITTDDFEHASEILDEISKKRIKYKEVPVFIDYTDYSKQKGQSILNSIKILIKMILRWKK